MKGKKGKIPQPGDPEGKFDVNPTPKDVYAGGESKVLAEAKKRKKGGKVEGDKAMSRCDRAPRKRGGRAMGGGLMSEAHKLTSRDGSAGMAAQKD